VLAALGTFAVSAAPQAVAAAAQKVDKAVPARQRTIALGEEDVKQLVLLMDANKNGKVSKKEFLDFMAAEFDRLDKDKSGELDVAELRQSQIRVSPPAAVGK
jgi:hypothetical protein